MAGRQARKQFPRTRKHAKTKQREEASVDLSAAEEYAIKIIAAESTLPHDARNSASAAAPGFALPDGLWPAVRTELVAQSVIGYPVDVIEGLELSSTDLTEYLFLAGKNLWSWYRLMKAQDSVLAEFRQADIPVAVLKGAAAAANYPQPKSRSMGDIDLIVPPDHFDRAFALLEHLGWETISNLRSTRAMQGFRRQTAPRSSCTVTSAHAPTSGKRTSLTRQFTTPSPAPSGPMSRASACPCCRRLRTAWCCSRTSTNI